MQPIRRLAGVLVLVMGLSGSGMVSAALVDRGNGLIYDNVLDITWLQDAGLGGLRTWTDAVSWADGLVFEGFDDWRLPSMEVSGDTTVVSCLIAPEAACRDNELGYMYYYNLTPVGDTPPTDLFTDLSGDQGLIRNLGGDHWSGTELASDPNDAWGLFFHIGDDYTDSKGAFSRAWAVRPGDSVAPVPVPGTVLLMGTALVGLLGFGRSWRRR